MTNDLCGASVEILRTKEHYQTFDGALSNSKAEILIWETYYSELFNDAKHVDVGWEKIVVKGMVGEVVECGQLALGQVYRCISSGMRMCRVFALPMAGNR